MLVFRTLWSAVVVGATLLLIAAPALAQGPSEEDLSEARQVFAEALELVEQQRWREAEERFRLVLQVRSSPVVSYNLASTLVHQEKLVEAAELLRGVIRDAAADAGSREAAGQLLADIEPRIGSLTVRLAGNTEGAQLSIDGRPVELGSLVQAISVDPGAHELVLRRDGQEVARESVSVGGAWPLHAEVQLEIPARADLRIADKAAALDQGVELDLGAGEQRDRADGGGVLDSPWFWVGAVAVVAGGVTAGLLLAGSGKADPIEGDTDPPVIRGVVVGLN